MTVPIDVGQRFGILLVLNRTDQRYRRNVLWNVQCDCGQIKLLSGPSLRTAQSCGCKHKATAKALMTAMRNGDVCVDLEGTSSGFLTYVREAGIQSKSRYVIALCACGKETKVRACRWGYVLSCGCYRQQTVSQRMTKNLVNRVFGHLTVISQSPRRYQGQRCWNCRCKCGNEIDINAWKLTSGKAIDCGCKS